MHTYYYSCFVVSMLLAVIYIFTWHKRNSIHISLIFLFCTIGNLGYWQLYDSTTLEQAILANKILYVGGSFSTLSIMLAIFDLCKIKLGRRLKSVLFLFNILIFCLSLTVGYYPWFYKSFDIALVNGKLELYKEYGFGHVIFYVMIVAYTLASLCCLVYSSLKKRKDVSIRNISMLFGIMIFNVAAFVSGRKFFHIELMPLSYDICFLIFILISRRLALYNVDETIIDSVKAEGDVGIAAFDKYGKYLGCNKVAKDMYKPLELLSVDSEPDENNPKLEELLTWIKNYEAYPNPEFTYSSGENFYSVDIHTLMSKNRKKGIHLLFRDCTEEVRRKTELIRISLTDELTSLGNRRSFTEELDKIQSNREDLVLFSMDLNGLKAINDYYGLAEGDELLKRTARLLEKDFGSFGKIYRTGGDEFAGILFCAEHEVLLAKKKFEENTETAGAGYQPVSFSFGFVCRREFPAATVSELKKEADQRMYLEKSSVYGRNKRHSGTKL